MTVNPCSNPKQNEFFCSFLGTRKLRHREVKQLPELTLSLNGRTEKQPPTPLHPHTPAPNLLARGHLSEVQYVLLTVA